MSKSLRLSITMKRDVTNTLFKDYAESFFSELLKGEFSQYQCDIARPRNIYFDEIYITDIYKSDVNLNYSSEQSYGHLVRNIVQDWCNPDKNKQSYMWLRLENSFVFENTGELRHDNVEVDEIAFGTNPDMQYFLQHISFDSSDKSGILSKFLHYERRFFVFLVFQHLESCSRTDFCINRFDFSYESLSYVVVNYISDCDKTEVFFHTKYFPFLSVEINDEEITSESPLDKKATLRRTVEFGCECKNHFFIKTVGRYPVFKMVFSKRYESICIIERLMQRCPKSTSFYFSNIKTVYFKEQDYYNECIKRIFNEFELFPFGKKFELLFPAQSVRDDFKFKCQFAWNTVNSRSLEVRDQIILKYISDPSTDHWKIMKTNLESYLCKDINTLIESLHHISEIIRNCFKFAFQDALKKLFKYYHEHQKNEGIPKGMCLIHRLIILPSKLLYIPPSEHFDNRVIRKFGAENFLRVSFLNDNFTKLTFSAVHKDDMSKFVKDNLLSGIQIGPRTYETLTSSIANIRSQGLWMYAKDHEGNTADSIKAWLGYFNPLHNIGKYMYCMGLCFSEAFKAAQIELYDDNIIRLNDILTTDEKYTFSKCVGIISKHLAKEIRDSFIEGNNYMRLCTGEELYDPSTFDIRYKGYRGIVTESTTLEGRKIGIRPSMEKFICFNSNVLEVVKTSGPCQAFLNRYLITVLESLGIAQGVFIDLQKKMLFSLADSLIYESEAQETLENRLFFQFPFKKLSDVGISLTQDPFFRSLLLTISKSSIENLKTRAHIEISSKYGRRMMGTIDETKTLKEGEIFVQYSEKIVDCVKSPTKILTGSVIVASSCCLHPGDIKKLTAVDVPSLHHIKDCIVFPTQGCIPVPDQVGGSNLHAYMYTVIWDPSLIFSGENHSSTSITCSPPEEGKRSENNEVRDIAEFFCNVIENDNNRLNSAYLAWADYADNGARSDVCMNLSKKIFMNSRFLRSGIIKGLLLSEKPKCYPDFMEKGFRYKSYKSLKSLGVLYRMIRCLEASIGNIEGRLSIQPDTDLEFPGWKEFEGLAKKRKQQYSNRVKELLNRYDLQSEADVFTGYVIKVNDYNNTKYDIDNTKQIAQKCLVDIIKCYRLKFEEDCDNTNSVSKRSNVKYMIASAWYMVTYLDQTSPLFSFPWIVSDILCNIKELNCGKGIMKNPSVRHFEKCLQSLHETTAQVEDISGTCSCYCVMHWVLMKWIKASTITLKMEDGAFCNLCFKKVIENFKHQIKCCSFTENSCSCSISCSPMKLTLEFLKYCASEVNTNTGICEMNRLEQDIRCSGLKSSKLHSLSLNTYAAISLSQSLQHLGVTQMKSSDSEFDSNGEGDPITIEITLEFHEIVKNNLCEVCEIIKDLTGLKNVVIENVSEPNEFCITFYFVGSSLQRWHLEELIRDEKFSTLIQSRIKSK